jgi:Rrf2 family protein
MLVDLAEHRDEGFISLRGISERQGISKQYLEQIIPLLSTSQILKANRGKQGGYMLARDPSEYTVGQILRLTEGTLSPLACLEDEVNKCPRSGFCKTVYVWDGLYAVITQYLDGITLQDIVDHGVGLVPGSC